MSANLSALFYLDHRKYSPQKYCEIYEAFCPNIGIILNQQCKFLKHESALMIPDNISDNKCNFLHRRLSCREREAGRE